MSCGFAALPGEVAEVDADGAGRIRSDRWG